MQLSNEQVSKLNFPPEVAAMLRSRDARVANVKDQQWNKAKEQAEIQRANDEMDASVNTFTERAIGESAKQRDEEIKTGDAVEAEAREVPRQTQFETDGAYHARLAKRGIEETRDLKQTMMAGYDINIVSAITDAAVIQARVDAAIAQYKPDIAERIALIAEARLMPMATAETNQRGSVGTGTVAAALLHVQARLAQIRREMAATSREGRHQRAQQAHELRVLNVRQIAANAKQFAGLSSNFVTGVSLPTAVPAGEWIG